MARYRKYSKDFKLQAAKLVTEQGYSYDKAAKRLGTTGFSVRHWVKKFQQTGELPSQQDTTLYSRIKAIISIMKPKKGVATFSSNASQMVSPTKKNRLKPVKPSVASKAALRKRKVKPANTNFHFG